MHRKRATSVLALRMLAFSGATGAAFLLAGTALPLSVLIGHAVFLAASSALSWGTTTGGRIPFLLLMGDLAALGALGMLAAPAGDLPVVFLSAFLIGTLIAMVARSSRTSFGSNCATAILLAELASALVLSVGFALLAARIDIGLPTVLGMVILVTVGVIETTLLAGWATLDLEVRHAQDDRMRLLGQTLGGVTHELANPLAALMGFAELLQRTDNADMREKLLSKIQEQAARATSVVRNLRRFVRSHREAATRCNLDASIDSVLELLAYEARRHGVHVHLEVTGEAADVLIDRHAVEQVLVNLQRNAIRELARPGREGSREIQIRLCSSKEHVTVYWHDSGPGVPADERRKVFDPFFTTHGDSGGMGLGLSVSRGIIRTHGGDLDLVDPPAEMKALGGACFRITLPRFQLAQESPDSLMSAVQALERAPGDGMRILVVDDEPAYREQLGIRLEQKGHRVTCVDRALGAERALGREIFDAVLLDVHMPERTGLEMLRSLRDLTPQLSRKVILMTGDLSNEATMDTASRTDTPLLLKPFREEELDNALALVRGRFPFSGATEPEASPEHDAPNAAAS